MDALVHFGGLIMIANIFHVYTVMQSKAPLQIVSATAFISEGCPMNQNE